MIRWLRNKLKSILLLANYLFSLFLLIAEFAYLVPPSFSVLPSFLSLGYFYLLLVNFFFLAFWLMKRQRYLYISLFSIIIGAKQFINFFAFSTGDDSTDYSFSMMSYNARYFNAPFFREDDELKKELNSSIKLIESAQPDILCAQEFSGKYKRHNLLVDRSLRSNGLKYSFRAGKSSLAIYSKFPIIDKEVISFDNSYNGAIRTLIKINNDTIAVYSIHLESIRLGTDENMLLNQENIQRLNQLETRQTFMRIGSKLSNAFKLREEQVRTIKKHMNRSRYPVFVCVDLNDLPTSYAYFKLKGDMNDAFLLSEFGIGSTYAGSLPFLRIDFCFFEKGYESVWYNRAANTNSDHFSIYTRFRKL